MGNFVVYFWGAITIVYIAMAIYHKSTEKFDVATYEMAWAILCYLQFSRYSN